MTFLYLMYIAGSLLLVLVTWTTLVWMLDAWRTPRSLAETRLNTHAAEPQHSFSLIVPARHEDEVLEATLSRLVATDHPAFNVLVVVGHDDEPTRRVAQRVARQFPKLVKVVVDRNISKNKPKALNTALRHCTGDITGVFDAEDVVHPALLRRIDHCFQRTDADVVQSGVQLMNFRSGWLAVRSALEYYFWFRSRLHFHARQGFIPLGGNTVFVRTELLRQAGGWDPNCLAEDCELGVRLSTLGARTVVVYEPALATREESPRSLRAFVRQRTRWNQGYLQTLRKGYWRSLPPRRRLLGVFTLAMPYLLTLAWILFPLAIATALILKAPIPVTLVSFLPLLPALSILAVEIAGLNEFARAYGLRTSLRDYVRLVLGLVPYQLVLAFAAMRAVVRELLGARGWEKTAHFGAHFAALRDGVPSAIASLQRAANDYGLSLDSGARALGFRRRHARKTGMVGTCITALIAVVVVPFFITHLGLNPFIARGGGGKAPAQTRPSWSAPWSPPQQGPPWGFGAFNTAGAYRGAALATGAGQSQGGLANTYGGVTPPPPGSIGTVPGLPGLPPLPVPLPVPPTSLPPLPPTSLPPVPPPPAPLPAPTPPLPLPVPTPSLPPVPTLPPLPVPTPSPRPVPTPGVPSIG